MRHQNLASNSLDALTSGGSIHVTRVAEASDDRMITLHFSDDGPGVPAALAPRIFDPFVTGREQGHGVGLATVKRRVDEMGGAVRLVPAQQGATFELRLPTEEGS